MKLTPELKKKIENYFNNIDPEYLADILVNEYGLKEINNKMELIVKNVPRYFIKFGDIEIDLIEISEFIEDSFDFEETIGHHTENYTNGYLYFENSELESILFNLNVIIVPTKFENSNFKGYKKYWLSQGYYKFKENYYNLFDKRK